MTLKAAYNPRKYKGVKYYVVLFVALYGLLGCSYSTSVAYAVGEEIGQASTEPEIIGDNEIIETTAPTEPIPTDYLVDVETPYDHMVEVTPEPVVDSLDMLLESEMSTEEAATIVDALMQVNATIWTLNCVVIAGFMVLIIAVYSRRWLP